MITIISTPRSLSTIFSRIFMNYPNTEVFIIPLSLIKNKIKIYQMKSELKWRMSQEYYQHSLHKEHYHLAWNLFQIFKGKVIISEDLQENPKKTFNV